jgi:hypothetical protein
LQHLGKAGALIDRIGTADGCIVVFANDGESCLFRERLYRSSLALITILFRTNIGRARCAEIGHRWLDSIRHFPIFSRYKLDTSRGPSGEALRHLDMWDGVLVEWLAFGKVAEASVEAFGANAGIEHQE